MNKQTDNRENDTFVDAVKQKLEQHRVEVHAADWENIQSRISAKPRSKVFPILWISGSIAATALILLSIFKFNYFSPDTVLQVDSRIAERAVSNHSIPSSNHAAIASLQAKSDYQAPKVILQPISKSIVVNEKNMENNVSQKSDTIPDISVMTQEQTKSIEEQKSEDIASTKPNISQIESEINSEKTWEDPLSKTDTHEWTVAALVSSGSNNTKQKSGIPVSAFVSEKTNVMQTSDNRFNFFISQYANKTFHLPVSFGLRMTKKLNKTFSVGTGLVYTYLQTDFENIDYFAKQKLHYLGIPIKLQTTYFERSGFTAYATAGGMIEKGLRSYFVETSFSEYQTVVSTYATKIDGLQWSLNASTGVSYNFVNKFDVYFEPKVSWYFENQQPISIRTQNHFVFEMEAGIRFNL